MYLLGMRAETAPPRFLDTLVAWGQAWRPESYSVTVTRWPSDRPKTAASVLAEGPSMAGEVIVDGGLDTGVAESVGG